MIFQEPLNSLNPAYRVYDQIAESVRIRHYREMGYTKSFQGGEVPFDYSKRADADRRELADEARSSRTARSARSSATGSGPARTSAARSSSTSSSSGSTTRRRSSTFTRTSSPAGCASGS